MTIALYELTTEFKAVADKLEQLELDEQTIQDTLEGYSADFDNKVVSISSFIRNLEVSAHAMKVAEVEMYNRRKAVENKIEHLKDYVLTNMKAIGKDKVECALFKVSVRNNPASIVVDESAVVPKEFVVTKVTESVDKKALKTALEEGLVVEGVSLVRNNSLSIK